MLRYIISSQGHALSAFAFCVAAAYAALLANHNFFPAKQETVALLSDQTILYQGTRGQQSGSAFHVNFAGSFVAKAWEKDAKLSSDRQSVPLQPDDPFASVTEFPPAEPEKLPWNSYSIKRNDTLSTILGKITKDEEATKFLVNQKMDSYRRMKIGTNLEYRHTANGQLEALRYKAGADLRLEFFRDPVNGMQAIEGAPVLTAQKTTVISKINKRNNSLFAASDSAGIEEAIIIEMISALDTRIDFQRETRIGDTFTLIFERMLDEDGEVARTGQLLGFRWSGKRRSVTGLFDSDSSTFYEPDGQVVQHAFLRSPVKFTRVSSKFSKRRFHPIRKRWLAHKGVDFAAPRGTRVRATGDGVLLQRGRHGGYGNVIVIRHFKKYKTVYGHLSKFQRGLKTGSRIKQGDIIGYVGSTGMATGPHLHYEFRINNVHQDPLSAKVAVQRPQLTGKEMEEFGKNTSGILHQLDEAANPSMASGPGG